MFKDVKKGMAEYRRNVHAIQKIEPVGRAPVCKQPVVAPKEEFTPVDRTSTLWLSVYNNSATNGHPFPEKMADSCVRSREKSLKMSAARAKTVMCDKRPPSDNAKPALAPCKKCKAFTLSGNVCGFAATCGDFCRRHAPS